MDQLSGVAHCCQRRVFARQPVVFLFDNLSPNRGYDVYLAAEVGGGGLGDAHVKNAVYAMLPKVVVRDIARAWTLLTNHHTLQYTLSNTH